MAMQDADRRPNHNAHRNNGRISRKPSAVGSPIPMGTVFVEGTVKFFNRKKGFGFIAPDQGGKDVFVSIFTLDQTGLKSLDDGQRVRFLIGPGDKRHAGQTAAYRVSVIGG